MSTLYLLWSEASVWSKHIKPSFGASHISQNSGCCFGHPEFSDFLHSFGICCNSVGTYAPNSRFFPAQAQRECDTIGTKFLKLLGFWLVPHEFFFFFETSPAWARTLVHEASITWQNNRPRMTLGQAEIHCFSSDLVSHISPCFGSCGRMPPSVGFWRESEQVRFVSVKAEHRNHPSRYHARQGGGGSSMTTTTRTWLH